MSTIAFVGCVKAKRPGRWPAGEKYISALFTKSRAYAKQHADRWYILSAKYGLLAPDEEIDDYDETLATMGVRLREAWARRVHEQIESRGILCPGDSVLWLAGSKYKAHLSELLSGVQQSDPLEGLRVGERLRFLTVH